MSTFITTIQWIPSFVTGIGRQPINNCEWKTEWVAQLGKACPLEWSPLFFLFPLTPDIYYLNIFHKGPQWLPACWVQWLSGSSSLGWAVETDTMNSALLESLLSWLLWLQAPLSGLCSLTPSSCYAVKGVKPMVLDTAWSHPHAVACFDSSSTVLAPACSFWLGPTKSTFLTLKRSSSCLLFLLPVTRLDNLVSFLNIVPYIFQIVNIWKYWKYEFSVFSLSMTQISWLSRPSHLFPISCCTLSKFLLCQ